MLKMSKINKFKWTHGLFGHNYRVAALSTLYLIVFEIDNNFDISKSKKLKIVMLKMDILTFW